MNLYLSSYGVGSQPERLVELVGQNKTTAVIANSRDLFLDGVKSQYHLDQDMQSLADLGLKPEPLDLRDYFGKRDELAERLGKYGLLWVLGGNAFVLLRAMNMSGFSEAAPELIKGEQVVYGGYSAGACVATPSLHGIELDDDPISVPDGYPKRTTWDGLALVDYHIAPHYDSDHPESATIDKVIGYFKQHQMPYRALRDGEVIIVRGEGEHQAG